MVYVSGLWIRRWRRNNNQDIDFAEPFPNREEEAKKHCNSKSANKLAANDDEIYLMVVRRAEKDDQFLTVGKNKIN